MTKMRLISKLSAIAVVICLGISIPAMASVGGASRVYIPFAFQAASTTLPAGNYVVEQMAGSSAFYLSSGTEGKWGFMAFPSHSPKGAPTAKLVFERIGDTYRLAEVGFAGQETVYGVPMTKAQLLVAGKAKPERIEISLLR